MWLSPKWLVILILTSYGCISPSKAAGSPTGSAGVEVRFGDMTLTIRAQAPDEAYTFLQGVLGDLEFFRANGYDVALPDHPGFEPDTRSFGPFETFQSEVYDAEEFERAIKILASDEKILLEALEWFLTAADADGFRRYDHYEVVLTLYGPGGSFDSASGTIVLLTTPEGRFKGGGGTHTIVHEMMHLAVEDGLVQRFGLGHWEKERLVDLLVQREFTESLPDYTLQNQGEKALDRFLVDVPLAKTVSALERYKAESEKN